MEGVYRDGDKPRQGVMVSTLSLFRNGAVGFIDWLDAFGVHTASVDLCRVPSEHDIAQECRS